MLVTKDNFEKAMVGLFYGFERSDYNSECFSTKDVLFHIACSNRCQTAIDDIRARGYEPKLLLTPVLQKYLPHFEISTEIDPSLKTKLDKNFQIEVDDWHVTWGNESYIKDSCKEVYQPDSFIELDI